MKRIRFIRTVVQLTAALLAATVLTASPTWVKPVLLGVTLLCGAVYCGWLCPLGFLQDLAGRLGRGLGVPVKAVPKRLHEVLLYSRYILWAAAALWTADSVYTVLDFEPYGTVTGMMAGHWPAMTALGVLAAMLLLSLRYDRLFCRYLCIQGAPLGLVSVFRVFTLRRDATRCVQCGACDRACPMQINVTRVSRLRSPQCTTCLECLAACPVKGALKYGR